MSKTPICVACDLAGKMIPAVSVDHILPAKLYPDLMFDETNLQPLCKKHHDLKTGVERSQSIAIDYVRQRQYELPGE